MKIEDFNALSTDILGKLDKPGEVTILLDQLRTTIATENADHEKLVTENAKLKTDNDSLTKTNGQLFIKLGEQVTNITPGQGGGGNSAAAKEKTPDELIADLFNEKGELK